MRRHLDQNNPNANMLLRLSDLRALCDMRVCVHKTSRGVGVVRWMMIGTIYDEGVWCLCER